MLALGWRIMKLIFMDNMACQEFLDVGMCQTDACIIQGLLKIICSIYTIIKINEIPDDGSISTASMKTILITLVCIAIGIDRLINVYFGMKYSVIEFMQLIKRTEDLNTKIDILKNDINQLDNDINHHCIKYNELCAEIDTFDYRYQQSEEQFKYQKMKSQEIRNKFIAVHTMMADSGSPIQNLEECSKLAESLRLYNFLNKNYIEYTSEMCSKRLEMLDKIREMQEQELVFINKRKSLEVRQEQLVNIRTGLLS